MKRFVLLLIVALGLTACGGGSGGSNTESTSPTNAGTNTDTATNTDTGTNTAPTTNGYSSYNVALSSRIQQEYSNEWINIDAEILNLRRQLSALGRLNSTYGSEQQVALITSHVDHFTTVMLEILTLYKLNNQLDSVYAKSLIVKYNDLDITLLNTKLTDLRITLTAGENIINNEYLTLLARVES